VVDAVKPVKTALSCQLAPASLLNSFEAFAVRVTLVAVLLDRVGAAGAAGPSYTVTGGVRPGKQPASKINNAEINNRGKIILMFSFI
jgi:hypothetical protein